MKPVALLFAMLTPLLLTACGNDDFQGRYVATDGITSYEFLPEGKLIILDGDKVISAQYDYDSSEQIITLESEQELRSDTLTVEQDGKLSFDDTTLTKGVDYQMLEDATWIGHEGQNTFALTFTKTEEGMETYSELVTYYDDDMTYVYQTDDSITRLAGDKLLLDRTQYRVSDVTEDSLILSIGSNSMQLKKYPKGTEVEFREGYQSEDDIPKN